jgi:hypothetical protein
MKKIISILIISMICSTIGLAQGVSFGVKGGVNFASINFSGDFSPDVKSKVGFHTGVFVSLMLSDKIGIQPEALYSIQGTKIDISTYDQQYNLAYINVPILLRYNLNDMISLHAGPQIGLLLSAEEEFDGSTTDIKDSLKGTDMGIAVGGEVDLPAKLGFGVRYVIGLSNLEDDSSGDVTVKNGVFQVYVKFRLVGGG